MRAHTMKTKPSYIVNGLLISLLLNTPIVSHAHNAPSVTFYASNNTATINEERAYERLTGKPQHELNDKLIRILQKNHIEQGELENILGMYQMDKSRQTSSDNTEAFHASPSQKLSNKQIFSLAQEIARNLNQESVAVFIPSEKSTSGYILLTLKSHPYNIKETMAIIREKLPATYSSALSLHLNNTCGDINKAHVSTIEWLGNKAHLKEIQKAFPKEIASFQAGATYLVYQDGHTKML